MSPPDRTDVVVVGAGAAGIGVGEALSYLDLEYCILERDEVGASFRRWPDETRLLTPSFPSNAFGLPDLNAIAPVTSPAIALDCEHPTGDQYAEYLSAIADHHGLPVETGIGVTGVAVDDGDVTDGEAVAVDGGVATAAPVSDTDPASTRPGFVVETTEGPIRAAFVVWAGGQFGTPRSDPFPGGRLCVHYATVDSWADHAAAGSADEFLIVGGFESGIDAATHLVDAGCSVTVLDRREPWATRRPDPSETLSPYTLGRLDEIRGSDRLTLVGNATVDRVERDDDGRFEVTATPTVEVEDGGNGTGVETNGAPRTHDDGTFTVPTRPILATGFEPNLGPVDDRFRDEEGSIELTDRDEAAGTPGLFLAGPSVAHEGQAFCFIYKFRARFPVVAGAIGERLGVDTDPLETYRDSNLFLEDLSCCEPVDCNC